MNYYDFVYVGCAIILHTMQEKHKALQGLPIQNQAVLTRPIPYGSVET